MAYRFTNTDKWKDSWFSNLKPIDKLLFIYLYENCDIAGFIEYTPKLWEISIGLKINQIEGALEGLQRGLLWSNDKDCIYIRTFLKHQKNLPINPNNKAHLGIMRRFELFKHKFDFQDINDFIQGASKGLPSPIGIGNGIDNDNIEENIKEEKTWRNDFDTFREQARQAFQNAWENKEFVEKQEYYFPTLDIGKTLERAFEYWGSEEAWVLKKSTKTKTINWLSTISKAIAMPLNKIYKQKQSKLDF